MPSFRRISALCTLLLLLGTGLAACGPANTNSMVSTYGVGSAGSVRYGTVVGMRPVAVAGTRSGLGAGAGAVGGGVLGSTIGGDWRARAVGGVAGALIGGLAGGAIEEGVTRGDAVEFIVRTDEGGDIAVVQTNELGLRPGDRVAITETDRVRLARAAGGAPAPAYYGTTPYSAPAALRK